MTSAQRLLIGTMLAATLASAQPAPPKTPGDLVPWPQTELDVSSALLWRTSIVVKSIERSLKVYRDGLGLRAVYTPSVVSDPAVLEFMGAPSGGSIKFQILRSEIAGEVSLNAGYVGLTEVNGPAGSAPRGRAASSSSESPVLLFLVEDIQATGERLRAAGCRIAQAPTRREDGTWSQLLAIDPDGVRLLVSARPRIGLVVKKPPAGVSEAEALKAHEASLPFRDCPNCPEMVRIAAGRATLGAPEGEIDRLAHESLPREVTFASPFAIGRTEVTRDQFEAFVTETGRVVEPSCNYWDGHWGFVKEHDWRNPGYAQRGNHPVVCVSHQDATAFAAWIALKTGRPYRLPSSAEFEYAMRAGSSAPWFWGVRSASACEFANLADQTLAARYPERPTFACNDGYLFTAPVGSFKPNAFGLYDMLGNAWEWTDDCWHKAWTGVPLDGSTWLASGGGDCDFRQPKGGSWTSGAEWARAATQSRDKALYRSFLLGFRLALSLTEPKT